EYRATAIQTLLPKLIPEGLSFLIQFFSEEPVPLLLRGCTPDRSDGGLEPEDMQILQRLTQCLPVRVSDLFASEENVFQARAANPPHTDLPIYGLSDYVFLYFEQGAPKVLTV
ncbi:MAG: hypothetical protein ACKPFK_34960, partial [Dolichospermum sp.]